MTHLTDLLAAATAAGVCLVLDPPDHLKLRGEPAALEQWAPLLRPHKAALVAMLQGQAQVPRRTWSIRATDGSSWVSTFTPPVTLAEILSRYKGAMVVPVTDPDPGETLPPEVVEAINAWLDSIQETDTATRGEVLRRAQANHDARADHLDRAGRACIDQRPSATGPESDRRGDG